MPSRPKYVAAEDGLFYCQEPDCERREGYKLPQHLGLHRFHHHGIKGTSRNPDGSSRVTGPKPRGRPPKSRPAMLSAEEICAAALEAVAPNGSIPIAALPAYFTWVEQTRAFFGYLLG